MAPSRHRRAKSVSTELLPFSFQFDHIDSHDSDLHRYRSRTEQHSDASWTTDTTVSSNLDSLHSSQPDEVATQRDSTPSVESNLDFISSSTDGGTQIRLLGHSQSLGNSANRPLATSKRELSFESASNQDRPGLVAPRRRYNTLDIDIRHLNSNIDPEKACRIAINEAVESGASEISLDSRNLDYIPSYISHLNDVVRSFDPASQKSLVPDLKLFLYDNHIVKLPPELFIVRNLTTLSLSMW